jgi:hypothetical protein
MPYVIATGTGASGGMSSLTFAEAKSMAAEAVGAQDLPSHVNAESALRRAASWLQREAWNYLMVYAQDLPIDANATEITLPTGVRAVKDVRVGLTSPATQQLEYAPMIQVQRGTSGETSTVIGGTRFYSFVGTARTGKITIVDPWGGTPGVANVLYSRRINRPLADDETLDLLEGPMELAYLDMGSYYIGLMAGLSGDRCDRFAQSATTHYIKARGMDKQLYGAIHSIVPESYWSRATNVLRKRPRPPRYYGQGW